jgi:heme O synthase-like polyprenyltransferase
VDRNRPSARRLFLASIAYLPLLLIVLALDKQ